MSDNLKEIAIATQKNHFKNGKDSICQKCEFYESDCFDADKVCIPDKKNGFSAVIKCSLYKQLEEPCKQ